MIQRTSEKKQFKHFIITLFNLKLWESDKKNRTTRSMEWLDSRFELFEKYCLPSVKSQTKQNFIWLCLFDIDTPAFYRERIERYSTEYNQLHPLYFSAEESSQYSALDENTRCRFIRNSVRAFLDLGDDYIITTNLDNDDALNIHFIERTQQEFLKMETNTLLSYNLGIQYVECINVVLRMKYPHNHFLTLVESTNEDFKTILYYGHAGARKMLKHIDIYEMPYWLEVVHSSNVSNDLRITTRINYYPCWKTFDFSDFGGSLRISMVSNIINFIYKVPLYFFRIASIRLRKKLRKMING